MLLGLDDLEGAEMNQQKFEASVSTGPGASLSAGDPRHFDAREKKLEYVRDPQERVRLWAERTGKSQAAWYRRAKELTEASVPFRGESWVRTAH
jgi:hypothetical protein